LELRALAGTRTGSADFASGMQVRVLGMGRWDQLLLRQLCDNWPPDDCFVESRARSQRQHNALSSSVSFAAFPSSKHGSLSSCSIVAAWLPVPARLQFSPPAVQLVFLSQRIPCTHSPARYLVLLFRQQTEFSSSSGPKVHV
jgi:hypothetical protein